MNVDDKRFDELAELWRSASPGGDALDTRDVLLQVKRRARNLDRSLFWRDLREWGAGVFVVGVMGYASWRAPGWLPMVGAAVVAACVAYVLSRLLSTRRRDPGSRDDLPLVDRIRAEIAKVEAQADLLRSVRSWYVMPLAIGGTAWVVSLVPSIGLPPGRTLVGIALMIASSAAIFTLVGWVTVKLNRLAVRKQLEPYRDELVGLLERSRSG